MNVRVVEKTYRTSDGNEFRSEEDAIRHETLENARSALDQAQHRFIIALAESQKTADGQPFSFRNWAYYRVRDCYGSLPSVERVSLGLRVNRMEIDSDNAIEFRAWMEPAGGSSGYWLNLRFDELYALESEANRACLQVMRERHAEAAEDIAAFERRLNGERG